MITEYEARTLKEGMHKELNAASVMWRCSAALLFFLGLVVTGPWLNPRVDQPSELAQAQDQAAIVRHARDAQD